MAPQLARGYHVMLDFIDEVDFCAKEFLQKVIVGKMRMIGTTLLAVTTVNPDREKSNITALIEAKDKDGQSVFNIKFMGLPCRHCRDSDKPWLCTHNPAEMPAWQTSDRAEKWTSVFTSADEEASIAVEWVSYSNMDDPGQLFYPKLLEIFASLPPKGLVRNERADMVIVSIDPGGNRSAHGIAALAKFGQQWMVCCVLWCSKYV